MNGISVLLLEGAMKVINSTSFALIAFGWYQPKGYGDDVSISPGQSAEVNGPYIGDMGDGHCYVALAGEVTCHESADDEHAFHVGKSEPLSLADGDKGFTIRHYTDQPEPFVAEWRRQCRDPKQDIDLIKQRDEVLRVAMNGHSDLFRIESTSSPK
ncbi:MAG: hypothetical protein Q8P17_01525 [bacterium]|nr:hypothetical protein [bacterium]